eukprot:Hpha_TRINITY_DN35335_c0_g1::TRINITY_DN35335_c0_g1_i1::g.85090::m.85090
MEGSAVRRLELASFAWSTRLFATWLTCEALAPDTPTVATTDPALDESTRTRIVLGRFSAVRIEETSAVPLKAPRLPLSTIITLTRVPSAVGLPEGDPVGALVGALVGNAEGARVGEVEGDLEGVEGTEGPRVGVVATEGPRVGVDPTEGPRVGVGTVGVTDGDAEGDAEGELAPGLEGLREGLAVGLELGLVGLKVGLALGLVGLKDGFRLGLTDGLTDGPTDGPTDGLGVGLVVPEAWNTSKLITTARPRIFPSLLFPRPLPLSPYHKKSNKVQK